jgi:hemolysin activation/secretion protein
LPVYSYGTRLSFDFNNSHSRLGGPYKGLGVKGHAQSHFFKLTHPLIQTAKSDLFLYAGYDLVNANTSWLNGISNPERLSTYNLNVLRAGLYGMTDDSYGRWIGNLGFDFGMGGNGHGAPQDTTFFKVSAGATRVQRLWGRSAGIVRVNGMYSPNKLFAAEQFQLGGPYTLRGYQPAEIIGDYGVSGTVEYRFPIPFLNRIAPKIDERIRLAAFYDFGWVGENGNVYDYPKSFLQSVGFGTYITFADWLTTQIGVGFPLGKKYYGENTARFYFSVNGDLDRIIPLRNPQKL